MLSLFNFGSALYPCLRIRCGIYGAEFAFQVLVVARLCDHGSVVCGVRKWRNMHFPVMPFA